jgi:hypothetical protein
VEKREPHRSRFFFVARKSPSSMDFDWAIRCVALASFYYSSYHMASVFFESHEAPVPIMITAAQGLIE